MSSTAASSRPDIPHVLPVRLEFKPPPLGFGCITGSLMTAVAAGGLWMGQRAEIGKDGWPLYLFCGLFAFFGLLLMWFVFWQMLLLRTPAPIVEISVQPFVLGLKAAAAIIQPGVAKRKFLSAKLTCTETHISYHQRNLADENTGRRETYTTKKHKVLHSEILIEARDVLALAGGTWQEKREFILPADGQPTKESEDLDIDWRIEVTGRGYMFGSFLHSYLVEVKRPGAA